MSCHIKRSLALQTQLHTQGMHLAWTNTCVHTLNATPQCTSLTDEGHSHTDSHYHICTHTQWGTMMAKDQTNTGSTCPLCECTQSVIMLQDTTLPLEDHTTDVDLTHCAGANNTPNRARAVHTVTWGTSWGFCRALTRSTQLGLGSHTPHPLEGLPETRTAIECGFGLVVMSGWEGKSLHFMCERMWQS